MQLTNEERELLMACRVGNADTVRAMLASGVSPNITDVRGLSAIFKAVVSRHCDVVRILIDAGADLTEVAEAEIVREMFSPGSTAPSQMEIPRDLNYFEIIEEGHASILWDGFDNLLSGPCYSGLVILAHALHKVGASRCAHALQAVVALIEEGGLVNGGYSPERVPPHLDAHRQRLEQLEEQYGVAAADEDPVARAEQFMLRDFVDD